MKEYTAITEANNFIVLDKYDKYSILNELAVRQRLRLRKSLSKI